MSALVQRLVLNRTGRDFLVGDLHGCYSMLMRVLRVADFDVERDRLLLTGDLGDRGPHSALCCELLFQPWVHSVMGNHEQMALQLFQPNGEPIHRSPEWHTAIVKGSMQWWLSLDASRRARLLGKLSQLPLALEVPMNERSDMLGIVHADVPQGLSWPEVSAKLSAGDSRTIETCLWSRKRVNQADGSGVNGIAQVYIGHTVVPDRPQKLGNVWAMDTGAAFGLAGSPQNCLSVIEPLRHRAYLAWPDGRVEERCLSG